VRDSGKRAPPIITSAQARAKGPAKRKNDNVTIWVKGLPALVSTKSDTAPVF
jgi:hypothetical protein